MTDTAEAPETTETPTEPSAAEQSVADAVAPKENTEFEFVLDKYKKEGRSDQESAMEQARAYKELQSKFGSFTGSPEEYTVELSEGLAEKVDMEDYKDDPILSDFKEMAKDMGMSGEGFNKVIELYFRGQQADIDAVDQVRAEEMKALGTNAERRLTNIQDWGKMNLDSDASTALEGLLTSADNVATVESLIAMTRNTQQVQDTAPAPSFDHAAIKARLIEKDDHGNLKMQSDPEFRKVTRKLYSDAFGDQPRNVTVGH